MFLAVSALVAIRMDPTAVGNSRAAYGLFVFYMGEWHSGADVASPAQGIDLIFSCCWFTRPILFGQLSSRFSAEGPRSPFFLFFVFVLTAAAYRWGLWETLSTAAAEVVLLWAESFVLLHVGTRGNACPGIFSLACRLIQPSSSPSGLFMLSVYLAGDGTAAGLSGGAAETSAGRESGVTRMLSKVRVEAGLTGTLEQISREIVRCTGQRG